MRPGKSKCAYSHYIISDTAKYNLSYPNTLTLKGHYKKKLVLLRMLRSKLLTTILYGFSTLRGY